MSVVNTIVQRTTGMQTPAAGGLAVILGIVNIFLWGIGTIIGGVLDECLADVLIGILQLIIPFVGWLWAIVWGVLMILKGIK